MENEAFLIFHKIRDSIRLNVCTIIVKGGDFMSILLKQRLLYLEGGGGGGGVAKKSIFL